MQDFMTRPIAGRELAPPVDGGGSMQAACCLDSIGAIVVLQG